MAKKAEAEPAEPKKVEFPLELRVTPDEPLWPGGATTWVALDADTLLTDNQLVGVYTLKEIQRAKVTTEVVKVEGKRGGQ